MISEEITKECYKALTGDQKLMLALVSDFDDDAKRVYDLLKSVAPVSQSIHTSSVKPYSDGVYYIYQDGTCELFDYDKANSPTKPVKRIGVIMGNHSLSVNLEDLPEQPLANKKDDGGYSGYIKEYDDAVADWNGKSNTEHIKQVGTDIELKDDEWIPSVAELYLIYFNKRSINAAIVLSGGSPIKDEWYWSSTEHSAANAWRLTLHDGYLASPWTNKVQLSHYVRAVAAFH